MNKAELKKACYAEQGITFENGKIYHNEFGFINELLVDGNAKIGKGCYHFSLLPTNEMYRTTINGKNYEVPGTCVCYCKGCYATKGNYRFSNVIKSLAVKTLLVRNDLEFVYKAITAQIKADDIKLLRIHASGDFDKNYSGLKYAMVWRKIAQENNSVTIWTYTKIKECETLFDGLNNANIVKSLIDGIGFNFGHCDYIKNTYNKLKESNESVYICKCGIDKEQHCVNCHGCSRNKYVLFIEHSTEYKAELDTEFDTLKAIINNQPSQMA